MFFFFIETRGATLEEIAKTFDGAEAVEEIKELALEKQKIEHVENVTREEDTAEQVEEHAKAA